MRTLLKYSEQRKSNSSFEMCIIFLKFFFFTFIQGEMLTLRKEFEERVNFIEIEREKSDTERQQLTSTLIERDKENEDMKLQLESLRGKADRYISVFILQCHCSFCLMHFDALEFH